MKVLVTGADGMLGRDLRDVLGARGISYSGTNRATLDVTDRNAVRHYLEHLRPDAVVHCAAWTAVDRAEEHAAEVFRVNTDGTRYVAEACAAIGAKLLYLSTDYVFSGTGDQFYEPDDDVEPLNIYGLSKRGGELAVKETLSQYFIVRTSWVFGKHGKNFVQTMLHLAETQREISVVNDQIGSPTYTMDLAYLLSEMLQTEQYGIYHATNEGVCSWAEFARAIFALSGAATKVRDVPASLYPTKAVRPYNSRLSKDKLIQKGFSRLPSWQDALRRYLQEIQQEDRSTLT